MNPDRLPPADYRLRPAEKPPVTMRDRLWLAVGAAIPAFIILAIAGALR